MEHIEQLHDRALDENGGIIHISNAISGANWYYCPGCKKEMQAVLRSLERYKLAITV